MPLITMTTDFGMSDGYVGIMKGVILSIAPDATIVDITHDIQPHAISQAAFVIAAAAPYFPSGTVHLVVVDPGVGSERRAIAVQIKRTYFVAPDNGVLTLILQPLSGNPPPAKIIHLRRRKYWLPQVSNTFHGRDVFAPVAAHLATGTPITKLGKSIDDPVLLDLPRAQQNLDGSIEGHILYVDRFGNLVTNIPASWLKAEVPWRIEVAGRVIDKLSSTYADVQRGQLLALVGSSGMLELSVREGSAALMLGVGENVPVKARPVSQD
ncbi:MAG: SAM-dependent chlorinase/fluorinase [Anaerolineae bacterium]|nr:SAM-dependent chlorinase/fluorinase [Anaerolineae bacterium]